MADRDYDNDVDGPAYAERWGVSRSTVAERAAQASRFLRLLLGPDERERLRTRWLLRLDDIIMNGEERHVAPAVKVAADLAGLVVHRHEVSSPDAVPADPLQAIELHRACIRAFESALPEGPED
jgi:hypothetical protein